MIEFLPAEADEQEGRTLQTRRRRPKFEHEAGSPEKMRAGCLADCRRLIRCVEGSFARDKIAVHSDDECLRLRLLPRLVLELLECDTHLRPADRQQFHFRGVAEAR